VTDAPDEFEIAEESAVGSAEPSPLELPEPIIDPSLYRLFEEERERENNKYIGQARKAEYPRHLKSAFDAYSTPETFVPGQLVQWKQLMKNRVYPRYGSPAVVVAYFESPQIKDRDGDLMSEPNDIILGILDGELDFQVFSFSSKRFTTWSED
jgi:hypothetical protein